MHWRASPNIYVLLIKIYLRVSYREKFLTNFQVFPSTLL